MSSPDRRIRGIAKLPIIIGILAVGAAGGALIYLNSQDGERAAIEGVKTSGAFVPEAPPPLATETSEQSLDAQEGDFIKYRDATGRVVYRMARNIDATGENAKYKASVSLMHGPRVKKNPRPPTAKVAKKFANPPRFSTKDGKLLSAPPAPDSGTGGAGGSGSGGNTNPNRPPWKNGSGGNSGGGDKK